MRHLRYPSTSDRLRLGAGAGWYPELLEEITAQFYLFVGPIAQATVPAVAQQCSDVTELYVTLATRISNPASRAAFLKSHKRLLTRDRRPRAQPCGKIALVPEKL